MKMRDLLTRAGERRRERESLDQQLEASIIELREVNVAMRRSALQTSLQARALEHDRRTQQQEGNDGA